MSRDISIKSVVHLPRMTRLSMTALAWQILCAAVSTAAEGLPISIERARKQLSEKLDLCKSVTNPKDLPIPWDKIQLSKNLNDTWTALSTWITGMLCMPADGAPPDLALLRDLSALLFADKLSFLKSAYREKWVQSEDRLKLIAAEFEQVINNCGGAALLVPLREAHRIFGEALGFTAPLPVVINPKSNKHFTELSEALRIYIIKVIAFADPEEPGSEELAQTLLVPLAQWQDAPRRSKHDEEGDVSEEVVGVPAERSLPAFEAASK